MSQALLDLAKQLAEARAERQRRVGCKFRTFFPPIDLVDESGHVVIHSRAHYLKHLGFFQAGAIFKERLFMAANRIGKTEAGAFELTCHLTGRYPEWWEGRRFTQPIEAWACGTNSETLRDIVQAKLFGGFEGVIADQLDGAGMVPAELVATWVRRPHGLPGSIETAWVKHVSGGKSKLGLKTYEQGRKSFEGTEKHVIWDDEEPDEAIYTEQLYRTATTKGITMITFTPLQGMSAVVKSFLQPEQEEAKEYKHMTQAGWDDVPHLDPAEKKALLATTPPHQRDARTKGTPQLGSGAIYAIAESEITVNDFLMPKQWKRCFGLDAGGGRKPTACVWLALDMDAGPTAYVYNVYKRESPEPAVHSGAILARGKWIPGVGDAAALITTKDDAEQIVMMYQRAGLDIILPDKAVESGIQDVWELMSGGQLKVFKSCEAWFREFRLYHRDEKGRIVKVDDHLMDATRYAVRSGMKRAITYVDWLAINQPTTVTGDPMDSEQAGLGWMR